MYVIKMYVMKIITKVSILLGPHVNIILNPVISNNVICSNEQKLCCNVKDSDDDQISVKSTL